MNAETISNSISIPVPNDISVSGVITTSDKPETADSVGVIIAHGAANDMENPLIVAVANRIAASGHTALRFNFPYREKGRKAPDSQNKLVMTWDAAVSFFKKDYGFKGHAVVAAGKSMGGRVASQMVGDKSLSVDGLILLGYPLHAPGKKDNPRDGHLYEIETPMLFFAGTRDALCDLDLLKKVLGRLKTPWELEIVEGGDHSFNLPASSNTTADEVHEKISRGCVQWIEKTLRR